MRTTRLLLPLLLGCLVQPLTSLPARAQTAAAPAAQQRKLPYEDQILAYEEADRKSPPPKDGVLFIGSSSIRLWSTLKEDFPELPVINRGFGGSIIADSIRYTPRIVLPYRPRMIVFYAGSNDIARKITPEQVRKDFDTFVQGVHAALPETRIVFVTINPSVSRISQRDQVVAANHLVEEYIREQSAKGAKLSYIDSYSKLLSPDGMPRPELLRKDGLHLNSEGYVAWKSVLKPRLLELWKQDKN
jgi:lysophospholipase L1-like esterase